MLKKSLYFALAVIVAVVAFTGCGGSENYIEDESILHSVSSEVINGELPPLKTMDGTSMTAEKGTFGRGAVISIIEKAFTGKGSDYLDNADKIYELRGILKAENPSENDIEITSVEKPVRVTLKSEFSYRVEARYIGIRKNAQSDWSFTCVDKFGDQNSARAYQSGSDIVYQTNRLGIEIALFAKLAGSEKLQVSTTVSDVSVTVESDGVSSEKPVANKIKISSGCYDDNMKVFVVPAGNGVNNLGAGDFITEITYMNNDGSDNLKLAGIDAVYEQPAKNSGTRDEYVHRIQVHNFNGTSDKLNFVLNTKGVSVDEFPMNFNVVVKNSGGLRQGALPFDYSDNIKVEELKGPKAPADIAVSSEKILFGGKITITWKPGEEVSGLTYDLLLSCDGGEESAAAENISETAWSSSDGENALKEGSYRFRILARDSDGQTTSSDFYEFSVVSSSERPEMLNLKKNYPYGEPVEISWTEVKSPLGGEVKYSVNIEDTNGEVIKSVDGLASPACIIEGLEPAIYRIQVIALMDDASVMSEKQFFQVLEPKAPEIPSNVRVLAGEIRYGNAVTITWDAEENIRYNVYLNIDSVENKVAENLSEGTWTSAEGAEALAIGSYAARIEAVNEFNLTSSAKPVQFQVVTAEGPATPVINPLSGTGYLAGEPVTVSWNAVQDPRQKPVAYNLWLYNSEPAEAPTVSSLSATEWTFNYLATGTYFVTVAATNGEDVSEQSAPASFAVIVPAVATLDTGRCTVYACDYYETSSEFVVKFNENNVDEETVKNVISVANVDGAKVHMEKQTDGFHITFTEPLPLNQTFTVSMGAMKDIYGYDVTPFPELTFTTIPFEGLGTEESPFMLNEAAAVQTTSDGRLPLIGSLTAEIGCFAGMTFTDAAIIADSTLVDTAEAAEWKELGAVSIANNAVVDIPYNRKWLADANGSVYMTFTGSLGGKTHHFKTAPKEVNTENGLTITLGDGSSETPYFVYTPQQLDEIREHLASAYTFRQMRDIDLADYTSAGTGWSPIGDSSNSFTGIYDGCGRTISNLRLLDASVTSYGLFSEIKGETAVVKNLTLDYPSIEGNPSNMGAIVGYASDGSAIENCHVLYAFIKANNGSNVGGIVGSMRGGYVAKSSFDGQIITAGGYNGGIIGETNDNTEVSDCQSKGSLVKPYSQAGGIVGTMNSGGSIKRCRSEMELHAAYAVGSLVGWVYGDSSFEDCEATGDCYSQQASAGGLVGCVQGGDTCSFIRCNSSGKVVVTASSGGNGIGGLVGYLYNNNLATFEDCYSVSSLIATGSAGASGVGGLVGYLNTKANVTRCYFKGDFDVPVSDSVGGLLGFCCWSCIVNMEDCYAIFDSITCKTCAAGLIAHLYAGGTINRCFAEFNDIEGTVYAYESLLAGFIGGVNSTLNCSKCYAKFNKVSSAGGRIGGFSGYTSCSGTISDCYALGNLVYSNSDSSTIYDVGGFLGYNYAMTVQNCYTTASVEVDAPSIFFCGTLIGQNSDGQIYSSFTTASSGYEHIGTGIPATNCYTLTSGYDSSKDWGSYTWNPDVWDNLTDGALPTLKF